MSISLELLIKAYANGYFPMADAREDEKVMWVEPKLRAILPLDGLHISKSLARTIKRDRFRVTTDTAFEQVISLCAQSVNGREETWINNGIEEAFLALYDFERAHSIECWIDTDDGPELVGGLYGLALRNCFFGESMFSRATDASKVALAWLVSRLRVGGYRLLDCQFMTDHLASLGATEIRKEEYLQLLQIALESPANQFSLGPFSAGSSTSPGSVTTADWGALDGFLAAGLSGSAGSPLGSGVSSSPGKLILHSLTQTS
jgi:leucyl/phenylalanyl-tRNA---protein transferase